MGGYHHTGMKTRRNRPEIEAQNLLDADPNRARSGSLNRLIFTIFATGSIYDHQIQVINEDGNYVCSKEAVRWDIEAEGPEISSESTDCGHVPWIKPGNRTFLFLLRHNSTREFEAID